uniref:Uncharacterized protein n=1 Tax=Magallana gigas TaxID=29159 RepID=A0A8W8JLA9_MAGGI
MTSSGKVMEEVKKEKMFTMNTNQTLKEVKKVWEIENGTGYIRGKVSTFNVTDNDLRSLCGINWLTDQVDIFRVFRLQRKTLLLL